MRDKIKNILIFAQGERGGTDYVLKSLANWLKRNGYGVCFANDLSMIKKQKYSFVILPTSRMNLVPALDSKQIGFECNKIIIWCMGSLAFHDAYYNGRKINTYPKFLVKLYDALVNTTSKNLFNEGSLIFTDEVGMYSDLIHLRNKHVNFSEFIFPIPISLSKEVNYDRFANKAESIAWIGRVDTDFKVLPLMQLIEDSAVGVEKGYFEKYFKFIIVGSGNGMPQLKKCVSKYKEIHFEFHEWLGNEELNTLLLRRVDILFAMGSSALLGASFGVPTVIVQPYSKMSERKLENYRWIDETIGHSLGEFPGMFCKPEQIRKTFDELFDPLSLKTKSRLSKDFSKKFDEDLVFERLLKRELPLDLSYKTKSLLNILNFLKVAKNTVKSLIRIFERR